MIHSLADDLAGLRASAAAALTKVSGQFGEATRPPGEVLMDVDATLIIAHS